MQKAVGLDNIPNKFLSEGGGGELMEMLNFTIQSHNKTGRKSAGVVRGENKVIT